MNLKTTGMHNGASLLCIVLLVFDRIYRTSTSVPALGITAQV
jgi:hypothetical protein